MENFGVVTLAGITCLCLLLGVDKYILICLLTTLVSQATLLIPWLSEKETIFIDCVNRYFVDTFIMSISYGDEYYKKLFSYARTLQFLLEMALFTKKSFVLKGFYLVIVYSCFFIWWKMVEYNRNYDMLLLLKAPISMIVMLGGYSSKFGITIGNLYNRGLFLLELNEIIKLPSP